MTRHKPTLFALLHKKDPERYHFLLWFKFIMLNVIFVAFMAIAYVQGWIAKVFAKSAEHTWFQALLTFDTQTSYIFFMLGVFLVGWALSVYWVYTTSKEINYLKQKHPSEFSRVAEYLASIKGASDSGKTFLFERMSEKWFSRIDIVRYISVLLPFLGLLGTVLGFAVVSDGIKPNAASDAVAAAQMITMLGKGLGVALYTTIAGGVLGGLWLGGIYQILRVGSSDFLNLLGEKGEYEARVATGGSDGI